MSTIQNNCPHPDEAKVAYGAGMDDSAMPDGHLVSDDGRVATFCYVNHCSVLNICARSDSDIVNIASQDGVEPDA